MTNVCFIHKVNGPNGFYEIANFYNVDLLSFDFFSHIEAPERDIIIVDCKIKCEAGVLSVDGVEFDYEAVITNPTNATVAKSSFEPMPPSKEHTALFVMLNDVPIKGWSAKLAELNKDGAHPRIGLLSKMLGKRLAFETNFKYQLLIKNAA